MKFIICWYDGVNCGYVDYEFKASNNFDNALIFETKEEAEKMCCELRKEWVSVLKVEEVPE